MTHPMSSPDKQDALEELIGDYIYGAKQANPNDPPDMIYPLVDAARAEKAALVEGLRNLANECEAEFTTDGYWNLDGALVQRKTVKAALALLHSTQRKAGM